MRRKLLTPAFHFRMLEEFLPVFYDQAQNLTQIMAEHKNLGSVNIVPLVARATLDVLCGNVDVVFCL